MMIVSLIIKKIKQKMIIIIIIKIILKMIDSFTIKKNDNLCKKKPFKVDIFIMNSKNGK